MAQRIQKVSARGNLHRGNVSALVRRLAAVEREHPELLVLDVRDVTLVDAAGLRVFLDAARRAEHQNRRFALAGADEEIRRVLRLTALDQVIELLPESGEYLSGGTSPTG